MCIYIIVNFINLIKPGRGDLIMEYTKNFDIRNGRNLTMLVDFYELTMGNGYLQSSIGNKIAYFDMYFQKSS